MRTKNDRESLFPGDIPHLGALCKGIRLNRGLTAEAIAGRAHLPTLTITRNFERLGQMNSDNFERYFTAFQELNPDPLTHSQEDRVRDLYANRSRLTKLQRELAAIKFEHIQYNARSNGFKQLVEEFAGLKQPAFITDDLMFVHAINTPLLRLFNFDHQNSHLYRWHGWHSYAFKIPTDSPLRQAYLHTNQLYGPSALAFFTSTSPYLFTYQMRLLLRCILELSNQNQCSLFKWWRRITCFDFDFEEGDFTRTVQYRTGEASYPIQVNPRPKTSHNLYVPQEKAYVRYTISVFEPIGREAQEVYSDLTRSETRMYYANEYDTHATFHVNTWAT